MRRLFSLPLIAALAAPAMAQTAADPAMLAADSVRLDGSSRLIAEGNVEALQGTVRIKAARIIYDQSADQLSITGPVTIIQNNANSGQEVVVLADAAQMDPQFRNGLLTGARMVLNQQVQLAAHQINRVNGRYSQLYKAAVTSCRVCGADRPPLWQIRAHKLIHDQKRQQLYFHKATFRIADIPIFYLPRLRLPDPSLDRATGFLIPTIRGNSDLGAGIKIPYFIRLGDHRDLTITPYLSPKTRTAELRYRQAFRTGRINFEGALSQDSLTTDSMRGYLFGEGRFDLRRNYKLTFDIELTRDKSYLVDYDYSDKDRLDSQIAISRVSRDEYVFGGLTHYYTLRAGENASTLPTLIGDFIYERRFFPARLGGELTLSAGFHSHFRYSTLTTDGVDFNTFSDGLDVMRLSAEAQWQNIWTVGPGIRVGATFGAAFDHTINNQGGGTVARSETIATPMAAFSLRWPWQKTTRNGAIHLIEPMVQLTWAGGSDNTIANDESTRVEFDEGNLMSLSRFPSVDRRERGLATAYGLNWTRLGQNGGFSTLTFGQVVRETADADFTQSSGLSGIDSDLLVAGQLRSGNGLSLTARALFDANLNLSKGEARASYTRPRFAVGASYVWLGADAAEERAATVSEWSVDGLYRVSRHWTGLASVRYDVVSNKTAEAGLGIQYRNECVTVDFSVSRRFTSSIILTPSTDFGFTIGLKGFTAKARDKSYVRKCSRN